MAYGRSKTVAKMLPTVQQMPPLHSKEIEKTTKLLEEWDQNWALAAYHILNLQLPVVQRVMLNGIKDTPFSMISASRGMAKSNILCVAAILLAILNKSSCKIGLVAPSYRQSKNIFERIMKFYMTAPMFANECAKHPTITMDMCYLQFLNGNRIEALPLGTGDTIRGARYNIILCDEWIHIPRDILYEVLLPMLNVPPDPIEQIRIWERARRRHLAGENPFREGELQQVNKMVLASTSYYQFHPSYDEYKKWKDLSVTDPQRYRVIEANYLDYPIFVHCQSCKYVSDGGTINYLEAMKTKQCPSCGAGLEHLKFGGYMDMEIVHHAMRTLPRAQFACEYLNTWVSDSGGFFQASHVSKCTPDSGTPHAFNVQLEPTIGAKYVLGVDPAREHDNFAMTILEVGRTVSRIVWNWAVNKKEFTKVDAYGEMVDMIRELDRKFKFAYIGIDKGGGGSAVRDMLSRSASYLDGGGQEQLEPPILEVPGANDVHDQLRAGRRIIVMVDFTSAWLNETAQSLRSALEHRELLFPVPSRAGADPERDAVYENVKQLAEELVSIVTEELPVMKQYLKFSKPSSDSYIDRAMSLFIAHSVAKLLRADEDTKDCAPRLAGEKINMPVRVHASPNNPAALIRGAYRSKKMNNPRMSAIISVASLEGIEPLKGKK